MIIKRIVTTLAVLLALATPLYAVGATSAQDVFGGVCGRAGSGESAVCATKKSDKDPISGSNGLLSRIANIVARFAGSVAVIIILVGSIRYITANGDPAAIKSAHRIVIGAVIGLVIIILARMMIYFVVSRI